MNGFISDGKVSAKSANYKIKACFFAIGPFFAGLATYHYNFSDVF